MTETPTPRDVIAHAWAKWRYQTRRINTARLTQDDIEWCFPGADAAVQALNAAGFAIVRKPTGDAIEAAIQAAYAADRSGGSADAMRAAADLSGYEEKAHAFAEESRALRAERDRYRAAWQNARERADNNRHAFHTIRELKDSRDRIILNFLNKRAEYVRVLRQCVEADADYHRWQGHAEARRQLAEALGAPAPWPAEDAEPGCPHCGDLHDPDRPDLHASCRRIPDAETTRDGRDA